MFKQAHLEVSLKKNIVVNLIGSIKDCDKNIIIEQTSLHRTALRKEVSSLNGGSTFTPFKELKNKAVFYADDSLLFALVAPICHILRDRS